MRYLVIGAGAVGCFVGARLAQVGEQVTLVGRQRQADAIARRGVVVNEQGRQATTCRVGAAASIADSFAGGPSCDLILLTIKGYDTEAAIAEIQQAASVIPPILSLQNGVGNEERLAAAFGPERIMAGVITAPVSSPEPGVVEVHRSGGHIALAPLTHSSGISTALIPTALDSFRRAGFGISTSSDWRAVKWSKLLLNILGNATSAILDWTSGRVFADARLATLEVKALREAVAVLRAQRIQVIPLGRHPIPLLAWGVTNLPKPVVAFPLGRLVGGGRGSKMPSLHKDLYAGKGKSEVEYLNGAVARKGRELGVPTPVNQALTDVLSGLVRGEASRDLYRNRPERVLAAITLLCYNLPVKG